MILEHLLRETGCGEAPSGHLADPPWMLCANLHFSQVRNASGRRPDRYAVENQDSFHQYASKLLKDRPVDQVGEVEKGHGRYEIRDLTVVEVDTELGPFSYVAHIIKGTRLYHDTKESSLPSMSVIPFEDFRSLNGAFETYLKKTHKAVSLILFTPITNSPSQANALRMVLFGDQRHRFRKLKNP